MRPRQNWCVCLQGRKRQDRLPAPAQISVLVFIMLDIRCWLILPLMASLFRSYTMSAVPRLRPLLVVVHVSMISITKFKTLKMVRSYWAGTCHSGQQRTWACQTLQRVPAGKKHLKTDAQLVLDRHVLLENWNLVLSQCVHLNVCFWHTKVKIGNHQLSRPSGGQGSWSEQLKFASNVSTL